MPTKSRADNKYHVVGELKLANREQSHNLIKMLRPVLSCITGTKVLLLTCLPKFPGSCTCRAVRIPVTWLTERR